MDVNLSKLQDIMEDRGAWRAIVPGICKELDTTLATEKQVVTVKKGL